MGGEFVLILASNSERRKQILKDIGIEVTVVSNDVSEDVPKKMKPEKVVSTLSKRKAEAALEMHPDATVIAADTVVVLGMEILGKPSTEDEAYEMLKKLSGNKHQVLTGVTIINKEKSKTFVAKTDVFMKSLKEVQIFEYVKSGEPFGKAGGYAIQGKGGALIERYEGDFFTVMGLPVKDLQKELKAFSY